LLVNGIVPGRAEEEEEEEEEEGLHGVFKRPQQTPADRRKLQTSSTLTVTHGRLNPQNSLCILWARRSGEEGCAEEERRRGVTWCAQATTSQRTQGCAEAGAVCLHRLVNTFTAAKKKKRGYMCLG
jgi:hypothetical protein